MRVQFMSSGRSSDIGKSGGMASSLGKGARGSAMSFVVDGDGSGGFGETGLANNVWRVMAIKGRR